MQCSPVIKSCGAGTRFDEGTSTCLGEKNVCGDGTVADDETGKCVAEKKACGMPLSKLRKSKKSKIAKKKRVNDACECEQHCTETSKKHLAWAMDDKRACFCYTSKFSSSEGKFTVGRIYQTN